MIKRKMLCLPWFTKFYPVFSKVGSVKTVFRTLQCPNSSQIANGIRGNSI